MKKAAITIGTMMTLAGGLAAGIVWVVAYVGSTVAPVAAKTEQNSLEIAKMGADIVWIKDALSAKGFKPTYDKTQ